MNLGTDRSQPASAFTTAIIAFQVLGAPASDGSWETPEAARMSTITRTSDVSFQQNGTARLSPAVVGEC